MDLKNFWNRINNYFLQKKVDKMMLNDETTRKLTENQDKVINGLDGTTAQEISIDNAQSWNPETGHPNGPSDSFAVRRFNWKDGVYNLEYRNGGSKSGTCTEEKASDFVEADSKGRAQRNL